MDFFRRLLPFFRVEDFAQNQLTAFWILAIILIFFYAGGYLWFHGIKIKKSLEISELSTNPKLKKIWSAYQDTFSDYGSFTKTSEFAESYFHEQNVLYASLDYRSINNVSNILVGLGILGTFAGLTYGISDSSFETTEEIKSSIDNLLTGMGTAFITSIWGMGLSLVYGFTLKLWQSKVSKQIQGLCIDLDKEYKIKQQELEIYNQNQQKKVINDIFNEYLVAETEDGRQLPKNVFRQLLDESVNQTTSLQTLSDDLSETIQLAMQKLIVDNNEQISLLIKDKLVPVLEDLKQIKQDSGTQVIESAVNRLSDSMKSMMDEFKSTISGDTKREIEGITNMLSIASESLNEVPKLMKGTTKEITELVDTLKESILENINESQAKAREVSRQNQQVFQESTSEYKSTVEEIQARMERLLSIQNENITHFSELTDKIEVTLTENSRVNQQFETIIEKSRIVVQQIDQVSIGFSHNADSLSETSNSLKNSMFHFDSTIKSYISDNQELLEKHKNALEIAKDTAHDYSTKFGTIQNGLTGIFNQIQIGLKDYQDTTRNNLNEYLSGFSTSLSNAYQGLESAVSGLSEINEELVEQIDKLANIR